MIWLGLIMYAGWCGFWTWAVSATWALYWNLEKQ